MNKIDAPLQQNQQIEIKDNSNRAKILLLIFWILTGLTLISLLPSLHKLQMLTHAQAGEYPTLQAANTNDTLQEIFAWTQTTLEILAIIAFLCWFTRAYSNLHRAGATRLRYRKSMALWAWFIPIICFFRPAQIMNEIWIDTQLTIKRLNPSYKLQKGGLLIGAWWTLYLLSNFVARYLLKTIFKEDTIAQMIESTQAVLILDIMQILEALLVIFIATKISKMEAFFAQEVNNYNQ